ncbi:MAG: bifunctional 5,10-methylene-tetrahydrofolate dehydrogenase/5,10-methylene-tetrahydrofolate cyclohydrolase [Ignavibacteriae bacterium]|nr:bifunctional 5,10-methylene-tetrahydrofolate dehydrogenase/5,10-methylene-tetrahydrofolate cyclohydrolase [Ignavibacteriota bacterium]
MAYIIDGKSIAEQIRLEVKSNTEVLISERGIKPGLAVLLVGENAASQVYVRSKEKACLEAGFHSIVLRMPDTVSENEVLNIISTWNNDNAIHGILVQLPLPKHINEMKALLAISPQKDVDGFHPENVGRLVIGLPGFVPCTPAGIVELFKRSKIDLAGKHVVVIGRSNIVGKPIANLLYQKKPYANAVVTICHTGTGDIRKFTKQADVLIAAIGVAHRIGADDVKDGVVVIDVGMNRIADLSTKSGTRLVGDVDYDSVMPKASAITPVPKGVGPMTIAMLLENTYRSAAGEVF